MSCLLGALGAFDTGDRDINGRNRAAIQASWVASDS